ncbi:hypothetical protein DL93DRAFT_2091244 [Clavulina sp. PMI_390]|nr:hypothetical protein DL93DRAFT_2091244 [Clavulina sp. PMI_390]
MNAGRFSSVFVLCLLWFWEANATVVQDTDPTITFDSTWMLDPNTQNSGGFGHRTNTTGGVASYKFTATDISMYAVTQTSGANFAFSIDNNQPINCTCHSNSNTYAFQQVVCSVGSLDGSVSHTLTIKHTDVPGQFVNLDFFQISNVTNTNSTKPHPKSSHITAIVGAVVGGVAVLVIAATVALIVRRRNRRVIEEDPALYGPSGKLYAPTLHPGSDGTQSLYPPSHSGAVTGTPPMSNAPPSHLYAGYSGYSEPHLAIPQMSEANAHYANMYHPGEVPVFPVHSRVDRNDRPPEL